ncbi:MAG: serine hydrolase, partial [Chitinophagaceae bacterium]
MNFQNYYILSDMRFVFASLLLLSFTFSKGQNAAEKWADSVYHSLSKEQRIAQLMVVRLSSIDKSNKISYFDQQVADLVKKYNIGGVLVFQGGPHKQADMINSLNKIAKTPIMFSVDGEWGLSQRIYDSVLPLPKQMMLGAMADSTILYEYGKIVAAQCRRLGIHLNYAPVVDVNNNPGNPVINDRSFGENKFKVAAFAVQYMKGMQDNGILACAKHFPGHGDVTVDSHHDLPVINKSMAQLYETELYPFQRIFAEGVGSVMIAHLYIPAIDATANVATSVSKKAVTDLLRNEMGYHGLSFTDALEMQGVQKYFPKGQASVASLIAGNDVLCLPGDVPAAIADIKAAIKAKQLSWYQIEERCKKLLRAKYHYVWKHTNEIDKTNITADLNLGVAEMRRKVAENAITLLAKKDNVFFPLHTKDKIAYVGVGLKAPNAFAKGLKDANNADLYYLNLSGNNANQLNELKSKLLNNYQQVVIGIHNINRTPANNFGIGKETA